jgi:hypothetical protein
MRRKCKQLWTAPGTSQQEVLNEILIFNQRSHFPAVRDGNETSAFVAFLFLIRCKLALNFLSVILLAVSLVTDVMLVFNCVQ